MLSTWLGGSGVTSQLHMTKLAIDSEILAFPAGFVTPCTWDGHSPRCPHKIRDAPLAPCTRRDRHLSFSESQRPATNRPSFVTVGGGMPGLGSDLNRLTHGLGIGRMLQMLQFEHWVPRAFAAATAPGPVGMPASMHPVIFGSALRNVVAEPWTSGCSSSMPCAKVQVSRASHPRRFRFRFSLFPPPLSCTTPAGSSGCRALPSGVQRNTTGRQVL